MPPFALEGHCLLLLKVVDRNVDRNLALLLQVGLVIELQDLAQVVHVRVYVLTVWYFVQRLGSRNLGELQAESRSFAQSVGKHAVLSSILAHWHEARGLNRCNIYIRPLA